MWPALPNRVKRVLTLSALCVLALIVGVVYWKYVRESPKPTGQQGLVTVAQEVKTVTKYVTKRVVVPGPERIVYLDKPQLAATLKMPELEKEPGEPLAAVSVPEHAGPTTAVAMIDNTGETRIITRQEPAKFFQLKKEFGIRAGMGTGGLVLGEVYVHPLRLGPVNVELRGFVQRSNVNGADFGAAILADWRF